MGSTLLRLIPAATLGALLASCVSGPAASHNLDELLDSNDQLRHVVELRGFSDELVLDLTGRVAVLGATVGVAVALEDDGDLLDSVHEQAVGVAAQAGQILDQVGSDQVYVGDPSLEALHQLLDLLRVPSDSLAAELRLIRQLARYASHCPGRLARERALLGMGPWLLKLKVSAPADPPRVPAEADDVSELLRHLISAWNDAPGEGIQNLQTSAEDLLDRELDLQGLWRVLKALEAVAERDKATEEMKPILFQLARTLEGRALAMALGSGLRDFDPLVRAAAMETGMRFLGPGFVLEALDSLSPSQPDSQGRVARTRVFGLFPIVPGEGLVVQRVLDQLAAGGLNLPGDMDPGLRNNTRLRVINLVIAISYDMVTFDEASRASALRALTALAPEGPGTRRKEEWEAWWREFAQQAQTSPTTETSVPPTSNATEAPVGSPTDPAINDTENV
ncbi:MAG TPA: hypothetical protein EYQ25_13655 [Planctomycetes bacterium]|nr:hypothetical protein [Planctomycetota bacterium]HIL38537.1 hypothetical protein [Planctomycetota bacterium]